MTPEERQIIKHAQNHLISILGGIDAVAALIPYSRSTVGRWYDVGHAALMPWEAFVPLQRKAELPIISAALAAIDNRTLSDPIEQKDSKACVMTAFAEAFVVSGQLSGTFMNAIADGRLTPSELSGLAKPAQALIDALTQGLKEIARGRAAGGVSVIAGRGAA